MVIIFYVADDAADDVADYEADNAADSAADNTADNGTDDPVDLVDAGDGSVFYYFFCLFRSFLAMVADVIDKVEKKITYYDSLTRPNYTKDDNILKGLLYLLTKAYERDFIKYPAFFSDQPNQLDPTIWSLEYGYSPKQNNGYDCGVHIIMNMYFLSVNLPLIHNDRNMKAYRKRLA